MNGKVLESQYRLDRKIGEGAFGEVWQGFDLKLNRDIAVKMLLRAGLTDSSIERFLREIQSLANLNHPNIVTVFDRGEFENRPFLVMELVRGPSLLSLISKTSLNMDEVYSIARQVCSAMSYAHQKGIIHRDLKLNNIMISEEDEGESRVKVLDFGLVKFLGSEDTTGKSMLGTPPYMSPEQLIGRDLDERTDIFSFGVCLFKIINGYLPFEGEHPAAITYSVVNEEPREFSDRVNEDIKLIILKCLEKDPRNRFRSFAELNTELEVMNTIGREVNRINGAAFSGLDVYADRSSKRNPYLNRVMISNPSDFFGREKEIRKIYSRLDAPQPQSISIVGERRIGKSSLLNFVYNRKNRKRNMQNYGNSVFVYLDFQKNLNFDVSKFIDFVFNVFGYETRKGPDFADREPTLDQFKEVIEELNDDGIRVILLMDEFDSITGNEKFDEEFFSFLRSIANSNQVAYVTSSCDQLQRLCHNKDISDSPFFNIFSNLPLRPFRREEALELIRVPSESEGIPLEVYSQEILERAGLFPFYIQIFCSTMFEFFIDNPDSEPKWDQITAGFHAEADPHFSFIWDHMDEDERKNLTRIARGKKIDRKYQFINDNLVRRGYLEESEEGHRIFSKTFKDFIINENEKSGSGRGFFSSLFKKK